MAKRSTTIGSRRRRRLAGLLVAALAGLAAGPAGALSITLAPATVSPAPGDAFALDLLVSDLAGAEVGAFDITLSFDPSAVAFASVTFDTFLGAIPAEATADAVAGPGSLALAEFSILSAGALDALQPDDSFRLATLVFAAAGGAPSTIAVGSALLGDAQGVRLRVDTLGSTRVAPIPEPAAALAFGLGVALAARASRRRPAR